LSHCNSSVIKHVIKLDVNHEMLKFLNYITDAEIKCVRVLSTADDSERMMSDAIVNWTLPIRLSF